MVQIGILLALACALATNVAVLCKYKGARAAAAVDFRHPLRSAGGLFRSRWWTIGFTVAFGAWILHVAALALAPISLVETVISGGLVLLAWFAGRWFGLRVGPREWMGLGLCAAGLALLGATSVGAAGGASAGYSSSALIAFEAAAVGIGAMLLVSGTIGSTRAGSGTLLGVAAGLLFGVANVSIKALTGTVPSDLLSIVSPWTLVALLAGIGSFFALARGLQIGDAIPVITLASVTANLGSVTGGILVFGDSMGADPLAVVARCFAFAAVIAAAAMMPAHVRPAGAHA